MRILPNPTDSTRSNVHENIEPCQKLGPHKSYDYNLRVKVGMHVDARYIEASGIECAFRKPAC